MRRGKLPESNDFSNISIAHISLY